MVLVTELVIWKQTPKTVLLDTALPSQICHLKLP